MNPNSLPRKTARPEWLALSCKARETNPREEQGLPRHPANGWIVCPTCGGAGEFEEFGDSLRSPECAMSVRCDRCCGEGCIEDGRIDPLVKLRRLRARRRENGALSFLYEHTRRVAMRPTAGLAQAEMLAMTTRCASAFEWLRAA